MSLTQVPAGRYFRDCTPAECDELRAHYHAEALAGRPFCDNTGREPIYLGDDHCRPQAQRDALLAFCADPANRVVHLCSDPLSQEPGVTGRIYRCTFSQMYYDLDGKGHGLKITPGGCVEWTYGPRMGERYTR